MSTARRAPIVVRSSRGIMARVVRRDAGGVTACTRNRPARAWGDSPQYRARRLLALPGHMEPFDVIVAGGGPGGSTIAALVAKAGHRVLLLERDRFPRYQIGES